MKSKAFFLSLVMLTGFYLNTAHSHTPVHPPAVAVSITPFYALVAAVMEGVGTPVLLVKPGTSPHEYSLKPSDIERLNKADIIFWGGESLESFLIKPLKNLTQTSTVSKKIIAFYKVKDLLLLPVRHSAEWDQHEHTEFGADPHSHQIDMHFWLDPANAMVLTHTIVTTLVKADPRHTPIYQENGRRIILRLKALDEALKNKLKHVKHIPFIVFHDAYQYFERRYHLQGAGSITLNPEIPPGARRLNHIRETIQQKKVRCVFTEPQFKTKLVQNIIEDLKVNTGELDPVGQLSHNNAEGYFKLLEDLSENMKTCLSENQ